jgi:TPR repeat protein
VDIEEKRRKAEAGSCATQTILGIDVGIDYKEAFRFLSAAASQGASRAVLNLGIMHAKGLGIPQNVPEAIRLFEAVARPSDSSDALAARIELGRLYSSGLGTSVDIAKAVTWYKAAIDLASDSEDSDDLREARTYVARANTDR